MAFNERKFDKIKTVEELESFILKVGVDEFRWYKLQGDKSRLLTEDFIRKYQDNIYWGGLDYDNLSESFIEEFKDKIDWKGLELHKRDMSLDFIRKYKDRLDWTYLSMDDRDDAFFEEFIDYINWRYFKSSKVSEDFIKKYKDRIDWDPYDCNTCSLLANRSTEFLWDMRDYIQDWNEVFEHNKNMPSKFILDHKDYFKSKLSKGNIEFPEANDEIIEAFTDYINWRELFVSNHFNVEFALKHMDKLYEVAKNLHEVYMEEFIEMMDQLPDNEYTNKIKKVLDMEVDYDYLIENDIYDYFGDEDTFYDCYGDEKKYPVRELMLDSINKSKALEDYSAMGIFQNILALDEK